MPRQKKDADSTEQESAGRSPLFIGSVDKMFRILKAFDAGVPSLTLTQIAAESGINLSAAQRFVYTLHRLGYLRKEPQTRHYSLSPKLLNLDTSFLRTQELARRATPYIRQASDSSGETISFLELDDTDIIHVIRYGALRSVRTHILLGTRRPALLSAGGRAIVAFLPRDEADRIVEQSFRAAIEVPDRPELEESLAAARRDGYSVVSKGGAAAPNVTLAAPVLDAKHLAIAAVEFTVPLDRWLDNALRDSLLRIVLETTQALSSRT